MSPANIGFIAIASRMGYRPVGMVLAIAVAGACAIWIYRTKPDFVSVSGAALCIGIVSAPVSWAPYVIFIAPFFVARRWGWVATAAAIGFFVTGDIPTKLFAPFLLLAVLVILGIFTSQMYGSLRRPTVLDSEQAPEMVQTSEAV